MPGFMHGEGREWAACLASQYQPSFPSRTAPLRQNAVSRDRRRTKTCAENEPGWIGIGTILRARSIGMEGARRVRDQVQPADGSLLQSDFTGGRDRWLFLFALSRSQQQDAGRGVQRRDARLPLSAQDCF